MKLKKIDGFFQWWMVIVLLSWPDFPTASCRSNHRQDFLRSPVLSTGQRRSKRRRDFLRSRALSTRRTPECCRRSGKISSRTWTHRTSPSGCRTRSATTLRRTDSETTFARFSWSRYVICILLNGDLIISNKKFLRDLIRALLHILCIQNANLK